MSERTDGPDGADGPERADAPAGRPVAETPPAPDAPTPGSTGPEHLPEHEGHGPVRPPQAVAGAAAAAAGGSAFEAVDFGPVPSEAPPAPDEGFVGREGEHPSVRALVSRFGDAVHGHRVSAGDQHVVWIDPARNLEILGWLKDDPEQRYDMMSDVTGVDYGGGRPVEVVYQMFSTTHGRALRVRCRLPLDALEIDSVAGLWKSADWLEREVYDLFGVTFRGHPDLRRILMPYDYEEGHPLRKDFPLRGRFSRAEQTRRALNQRVERFYRPEELAHEGHEPQQVAAVGPGRRPYGVDAAEEAAIAGGDAAARDPRAGRDADRGGAP